MDSKVLTAQDFFENWCKQKGYTSIDEADNIDQCMIEFTKIHLEQALLEINDKIKIEGEGAFFDFVWIDKESILEAYPLENIK
jgi:hypothetical protein